MTAEVRRCWSEGMSGSSISAFKQRYGLQCMLGQMNCTDEYLVAQVVLPGRFCFLDPRLMLSDIRKGGISSLNDWKKALYLPILKKIIISDRKISQSSLFRRKKSVISY